MTTPTPSVCLITCPVCGTEGATSNEASINKELFRLRRDLAAAKDTISKYHERIISQHAQIDDLKWSLWKIEGKHKAAILEVITKLAAAQEALAVATRERNDAINASLADLTASQRAEALAAQNAKDAERYRWLREGTGLADPTVFSCTERGYAAQPLILDELDAAIDAAIAEGKK